MPIYALDDVIPQLEDGTWVAPDANIIGKVVLEKMPRSGSAAPCAAITSRSSWGRAATCRKTWSCTPTPAFR